MPSLPPPPPQDGKRGCLAGAQLLALKELWALLFAVFDGTLDQFTLRPPAAPAAGAFASPAGSSAEGTGQSPQSARKPKTTARRLGKLVRSAVKPRVNGGLSSSSNAPPPSDDAGGSSGSLACASAADLVPEQLLDALFRFVQNEHPDSIVLRFLRARKWDVGKAAHMILNTIRWRVGVNCEEIIAAGEERLERKTFESGKTYIRGIDYYGRPVVYIHVRKHQAGELALEELQRFTIWVMETTRLLVPQPEGTAAMVFDLTDFSLPNMDFPYTKFLIQCFEAYYPESLGMLLIYNAPWLFSSVWKFIAPLLDPVVASKIYFVKNVDDLANYLPATNILPVFWTAEKGGEKKPPPLPPATASTGRVEQQGPPGGGGGGGPNAESHAQDRYEYTYVPPPAGENPDPEATAEERTAAERKHLLAARRFERATRAWCDSARAAGSPCLSARDLDEEDEGWPAPDDDLDRARDLAAAALRRAWWKLDPYVRARTLYHRIGVLQKEGDDYVARWYSENQTRD